MNWQKSKLLDATVWLAETAEAFYRIIERDNKKGHFQAAERIKDQIDYMPIMSSNTLGAAKQALEAYSQITPAQAVEYLAKLNSKI